MTHTSQPIRIFIGSSPKNTIEEAVFRYTLQKYASLPLEIHVIDGQAGSETNLSTGEVKVLPPHLIQRIRGATAFSLARWAIPEWCGYEGRAIYCDSDQLALTDIAKLWNYDLGENVLAAVPVKKAQCYQHYIEKFMQPYLVENDEFYLASVVLFDCAKAAHWGFDTLTAKLEQQAFSFSSLMYLGADFRNYFNVTVKELPSAWNHLDYQDETSQIIHFTDLTSQPWRFHHNPISDVWEDYYLAAIAAGFISRETIIHARRQGWITGRIKTLGLINAGLRQPVNSLWRGINAAIFLTLRTIGVFALQAWFMTQGRRVKALGRRLFGTKLQSAQV